MIDLTMSHKKEDRKTIAYWNDSKEILAELRVPVEDRSIYFGDAVYEVIRVYQGKLWLGEEHFSRLKNSLTGIRINYDTSAVYKNILANVAENQIENGYVYLQISRGTAPRNHIFPQSIHPNIFIYSKEFVVDPWLDYRESGIKAILSPDIRWLRRDIKSTNLLANCLAKQDAVEQGAQEVIFYEPDNCITEASANNVFIVQKRTIKTAPATHHILNGITRQYILKIAKTLEINVLEKSFTCAELFAAEEVFITGTTSEILLVNSINDKPVSTSDRKIYSLLRNKFTTDIIHFSRGEKS